MQKSSPTPEMIHKKLLQSLVQRVKQSAISHKNDCFCWALTLFHSLCFMSWLVCFLLYLFLFLNGKWIVLVSCFLAWWSSWPLRAPITLHAAFTHSPSTFYSMHNYVLPTRSHIHTPMDASVGNVGVQCLPEGRFNMWPRQAGVEPPTFRFVGDCSSSWATDV